ncbi:MAG: VanZ family protein [Planctomycetaceae bacterium]
MTTTAPSPPTFRHWPARLLGALATGYAGLLVWATHHPKPQDFLGRHPPSDKFLHVAAYAILGALVAATLAAAGRLSPRIGLRAGAALAAFGILDEVTQPLPWFRRTADPLDWVFDLAGIVLGIAAVAAVAAVARRLRAGRWAGPQ